MINRKQKAQKINKKMKELLDKNPALKKALRVFDISYDQYQKSLEGKYSLYTDTTTSPAKMGYYSNHK